MKRFRHYIINGSDKKEIFTPPPKTFSVYKNEDDDDDDDEDDSDENMDMKANEVEKKLKMNPEHEKRKEEKEESSGGKMESEDSDKSKPGSSNPITDSATSKKIPKSGSGPDPNKPKCRKAKDVRRERFLLKHESEGIAAQTPKPKHPTGDEKTIEDFLSESFPGNSKHKFEIRILNAQTTNEEFMKSFEESLQV